MGGVSDVNDGRAGGRREGLSGDDASVIEFSISTRQRSKLKSSVKLFFKKKCTPRRVSAASTSGPLSPVSRAGGNTKRSD